MLASTIAPNIPLFDNLYYYGGRLGWTRPTNLLRIGVEKLVLLFLESLDNRKTPLAIERLECTATNAVRPGSGPNFFYESLGNYETSESLTAW